MQSTGWEGATQGGDAVSEMCACIGAGTVEPIVRAGVDATIESFVGTSDGEIGSVLPEDILQQVEPGSGSACT